MNTAAAAVATLAQVRHRYGKVIALDGVDLAIPAGCLAGIIGPDGVGKSTLLSLIAGARRVQKGSGVTVLDEDMHSAAARSRMCRRIAYMPQGLGKNLYPTLSVMENICFFADLFGEKGIEREQRIAHLLQATGMTRFADRPAAKLSGGMKQKLSLCCSLIHEPDLLILDEPTTGVDPLSRRQFWQLLDDLRAQRPSMSIVVATAYIEEASSFDWLAMMDAGNVLAQGSPTALLQQTGANNLDAAFIRLLPPEKREGHVEPVLPPLQDAHQNNIVISARNLSCRFGDFTAVDSVNFEIRQGEIFGFLGSNGCGKSTTMKMLTGLLPATEGEAFLFGNPVNADDISARNRLGYMSQSFSLYEELNVIQNLELHGRIFAMSGEQIRARCETLLREMQLAPYAQQPAGSLPLGVRQRLSLAVAVIHNPVMLILDEPTSGVDPVARDSFWELLIDLSRKQGVTIFITTHYMNEADRCDRISLMDAGKVLASGSPEDIRQQFQVPTLEDAFIQVLEQARAGDEKSSTVIAVVHAEHTAADNSLAERDKHFSFQRLRAYARRETLELMREPIRLLFAFVAPLFLMMVLGMGVNFDVDRLDFAVLDQDNTPASREYIDRFSASDYFVSYGALHSYTQLQQKLSSGQLLFALEIPSGFGADLAAGREPAVAVQINGGYPFRAERARNYILGIHQQYLQQLVREQRVQMPAEPYRLETRFQYNQEMLSAYAIVPSIIAVLVTMIPTMLMAVAVVREKELGSIINFYATPTRRLEFLWGKQVPYVMIAMINYLCLVLITRFAFQVPLLGSLPVLMIAGVCYSWVATSFGLLISAFTRTQIAALFAALIISMIPSVNFSGMLKPVASLEGGAYWFGTFFPTTYLLNITVGTFTKGLYFADLWKNFAVMAVHFLVFTLGSVLLLRKQEA
ncbi:MAG: ribosome-associated ATPase/putative transporter RbbA [Pseudomonadales bacterium]